MGVAMSEVICSRIKLKAGSIPKVREWAQVMHERRQEALSTLEAEGVLEESVFLDHAPDGDYLVIFMRATNLQRAQQMGRESQAAIDQYHRQFKQEVFESGGALELLVDLHNF